MRESHAVVGAEVRGKCEVGDKFVFSAVITVTPLATAIHGVEAINTGI